MTTLPRASVMKQLKTSFESAKKMRIATNAIEETEDVLNDVLTYLRNSMTTIMNDLGKKKFDPTCIPSLKELPFMTNMKGPAKIPTPPIIRLLKNEWPGNISITPEAKTLIGGFINFYIYMLGGRAYDAAIDDNLATIYAKHIQLADYALTRTRCI